MLLLGHTYRINLLYIPHTHGGSYLSPLNTNKVTPGSIFATSHRRTCTHTYIIIHNSIYIYIDAISLSSITVTCRINVFDSAPRFEQQRVSENAGSASFVCTCLVVVRTWCMVHDVRKTSDYLARKGTNDRKGLSRMIHTFASVPEPIGPDPPDCDRAGIAVQAWQGRQ